jgi:hypothetical protein
MNESDLRKEINEVKCKWLWMKCNAQKLSVDINHFSRSNFQFQWFQIACHHSMSSAMKCSN